MSKEQAFSAAQLTFRGLHQADLPLMQRWLNAPHVLKWWKEPLTLEQTEAKYAPLLEGREPTYPYLVLLGDTPIGYVQSYRIADWPEYAAALALDEEAIGVDLFIGEAEYLYRGLGAELLRRFLREEAFPTLGTDVCVIGPAPENHAAIRAYEKAGFRYVKTVHVPGEDVPEYVMRLTRSGLL